MNIEQTVSAAVANLQLGNLATPDAPPDLVELETFGRAHALVEL